MVSTPEEKCDVSVIVPTRNSERTLERCLITVRRQTHVSIEIVIVDAYSTDATHSIADKFADVVLKLPGERSEARNFGASVSSGRYLMFIDSDMCLSPTVAKECVAAVQPSNNAVVIVPEVSIGRGFWSSCRALEKECYQGDDAIEAARFFPRAAYDALGGYDTTLGPAGEDWDLTIRARGKGYGVTRVKSCIFHDEGHLTLDSAVRKKYYYGKHLWRFSERYGPDATLQLTPLRRAFFANLGKLSRNPLRAAGLIVLKTSEYFAIEVGMLAGSH